MKTYKRIEIVKAKLFEKGEQDGYTNEDMIDTYEDGAYEEGDEDDDGYIVVPYVNTGYSFDDDDEDDMSIGRFGNSYLCILENGKRKLIEKTVFESTFQEINEA